MNTKWKFRCFKPRDGKMIGLNYYKSISLQHIIIGLWWRKINIFRHL